MIPKNSGTPLQLISKMTSVTNRIDLKSARAIFDSLRKSLKIKLPNDLINSIDGIIMNNMTNTMDDYTFDLSEIRWDLNEYYKGKMQKLWSVKWLKMFCHLSNSFFQLRSTLFLSLWNLIFEKTMELKIIDQNEIWIVNTSREKYGGGVDIEIHCILDRLKVEFIYFLHYNFLFSKLVCAEISKKMGASKRVFHQTVNAQNSMLSKEIHDQGKII